MSSNSRSVASSERPELAQHQKQAIDWIRWTGLGLLGDEPGLGKSRTAIEAFDGGRVLVVAPNLIISSGTWDDELTRWADHPHLFTVAPYSMLNARAATAKGGTTPVNALRPEFKGKWDAMIVDEAHYTKGRKTSWTWAVEEIADHCGSVLEMTGTPIPNWPHELFTILRVLRPTEARPGKRLGGYWNWAKQWFEITNPTENLSPRLYNPRAMQAGDLKACYPECLERPATDPCQQYLRFVEENLGEQFLRRLRDDVLDLPPITESEILTPMDAETKRVYRRLKTEMVAEMDGQEIVAWTSGAKNVMLDRVTTSPWLLNATDPESGSLRPGFDEPVGGKFERLEFDLSSRSRPTFVVAHYRSSVEAAARVAARTGARAAYVHGGVPDERAGQTIRDFKSGKIDVLVGSIEMVSEGLTLTQADMCIFLEKSYKPSRNEQAMRRIHRMGQTRPVTVLDYVTPNSVDSGKRIMLATKTDRQMRVMTAAQLLAIA